MLNSFKVETLDTPIEKNTGLAKPRGFYKFDLDSLEYQSAMADAITLRSQVYEQAESLFKTSPKILQQLRFEEDGQDKGMALSLFSHKFPPSPLNAAMVLKRFLQERAELLISPEEKPNLKVLLAYLNELIAVEMGKN